MVDVPDETWKRIQELARRLPAPAQGLGAPHPFRTIADRMEWGIAKLETDRDEFKAIVGRVLDALGVPWTAGTHDNSYVESLVRYITDSVKPGHSLHVEWHNEIVPLEF